MESICLYTIVNPINGVKDYTCNPDYAESKSKEGYVVHANVIQREPKRLYYFKG